MQRRTRFGAVGFHFGVSLILAVLAAGLVFGLWYPGAYRELAGGVGLFGLIVAVDVMLGPLLTLVVFNTQKPKGELMRDLAVVGLMQLAALGYGLHIVYEARPVHLVFEVDRFRVVTAADIDPRQLRDAPPQLRRLPLAGPTVIAARRSQTNEELMQGVTAAVEGIEISMQPARWQVYNDQFRKEAVAKSRKASSFAPTSAAAKALAQVAQEDGLSVPSLAILPLQSRFRPAWSTVIDENGQPLRLVPVDSFQ